MKRIIHSRKSGSLCNIGGRIVSYWKRLERNLKYTSDWLSLTVDKLELPDGRIIENFELLHFPHEAVGVVAVNDIGDLLLVRAYRYLYESFKWEIPGGVVERGESALEAARRELTEETGFCAGILTPMLVFYPHKATCDQKYHLYLAEELKKAPTEEDKVEVSEKDFHSPATVKRMIDSGEIDDGMSLLALHRYFLKMKK